MINTVTGSIAKKELGLTLAHEHLNWNSSYAQYLYFDKMYDDKQIQDFEELYNNIMPVFNKLYQQGCRAVVETSPPRGGQNLRLMQQLSLDSGVKIIPNTGLIFSRHVFQIHKQAYAEQLAQRWITDYEDGLDQLNGIIIRPSHIKILLPGKDDLPEVDREILKAAVIACKATGLPIHCHILGADTAERVIDFLEEEDFDFSKFLWAHASYRNDDKWNKTLQRAIDKEMWLGFDMIQTGTYAEYLSLIKQAIADGYDGRILLSQDYDFYGEVSKHGDQHPCASILTDFIPYCNKNGLLAGKIIDIMTENPANFYNIE